MNLHFSNHSLFGGLSALLIASLLSACAQPPESREPRAPATVTRLPWSAEVDEAAHDFTCKNDEVLIGRHHWDAEDFPTKYRCGKVFQYQDIKITEIHQSTKIPEHHGRRFVCPDDEVMVGRGHSKDENGYTWYYCGKPIDYWGNQMSVVHNVKWIRVEDEEYHGEVECADNQVMTGRWHEGDETKPTEYLCSTLY
ncbi:hypothetical protein V0R50_09095 [Pseudomonas sp. 148P]|uniref:Lipoprotein n=1 Tax=Pseudomonas ulcerans TaxID=3115852 RepID=A0ABU7HPG1_9PSED|nr:MULTISPECIES: hypothetical protein [unclassified Pseudomonas]MEE1920596.1 hypothetical protein [Pseudomonas sp. 147P]MEE1933378.1 hypothetical protein [Pseudomonas sp. 148P]